MKYGCYAVCVVMIAAAHTAVAAQGGYLGKRVLYVNSYHRGYEWSDGEQRGAEQVFAGTGVVFQALYMDTKNNPSEEFCREAGARVKTYADEFKPDVLITADDSAFVYVAKPYYRDAPLPVVFCGINWDISHYGAPYRNTTGMIEVSLIGQLCDHLRRFAKGDRIGFIGFDSPPERRNAGYFARALSPRPFTQVFVGDFSSWKKAFLAAQDKADMLVLGSNEGIQGWDQAEAERFTLEHARVPVGSDMENMAYLLLIGVAKSPEEQGEFAARAALRILDGAKPSAIPVESNKKGHLVLNVRMAGRLGVIFSPSMFKNATKVVGMEQ